MQDVLEKISLVGNMVFFHGNLNLGKIPYLVLNENTNYVNKTDFNFLQLSNTTNFEDYLDFVPMSHGKLLLYTKRGKYSIISYNVSREQQDNIKFLRQHDLHLRRDEFVEYVKLTKNSEYLVVSTMSYNNKGFKDFDDVEAADPDTSLSRILI